MVKIFIKKTSALIFLIFCTSGSIATAGFLEMPEIEQFRDSEEGTLLRDLDVPGVVDRSPDPTAGPRLAVTEFRIQGLVEYPELGITHQSLAELVEGIRFEIMDEGNLLESGYTVEELGDLSDLLVDIEKETVDRHVTPLEVQKLVWLIREQRGKRGVTLGQIETVAHEITRFYRKRGFVLAKAYIPKQRVRDGVVNLTLLLGMLGEVSVSGNQLYNSKSLQSVFSGLLAQPVINKTVEESLYLINDFPGVNVEGYFEPGYQVGDTRLNINVRNETRYNAYVRVDNHGTDESGLYRFYTDFQLNNLFGIADYLKASLLEAKSPSNTTYWQLIFASNFFSPYFRIGLESSRNQFIVDQSQIENIDLNGEVDVFAVNGKYIRERGRTKNSSYEFRFEIIKSDLQIGDLPDINNTLDEELTHYSLKYNFDFLDDVNKRLHEASVKYTRGRFDVGADPGQDERYDILSADYTLLNFLNVPFTESHSRLIFRSSVQYAGGNLSSIARFPLAGPTRARGFSPSFFTADDAIYLGTDWIFNSPDWLDVTIATINIKNLLKPFVFVDYGYGKQYTIVSNNSDATGQLADIGFGLQFSYANNFNGNLQLAFNVLDEFSETEQQPKADSVRVLFDFQYGF